MSEHTPVSVPQDSAIYAATFAGRVNAEKVPVDRVVVDRHEVGVAGQVRGTADVSVDERPGVGAVQRVVPQGQVLLLTHRGCVREVARVRPQVGAVEVAVLDQAAGLAVRRPVRVDDLGAQDGRVVVRGGNVKPADPPRDTPAGGGSTGDLDATLTGHEHHRVRGTSLTAWGGN